MKKEIRETLTTLIFIIFFISTIIFSYFMPEIFWNLTWNDLISIISKENNNLNSINKFTEITQKLGITQKTLHNWAIERIIIMISLSTFILILLVIIHHITYKLINKK